MSENDLITSDHAAEQPNQDVQKQVSDELGLYVYMLVDPRDGLPFYVGKGRGVRYEAHRYEAEDVSEDEAEKSAKIKKIRKINAAGYEHECWILRYGMTTKEYTAVEAAAIDLLRSLPFETRSERAIRPEGFMDQLTNARREASQGHGIILLDDLVAEKQAPPLTLTEVPMLIIKLSNWEEKRERIPGGERRGNGYKREWLTSAIREKHFEEIGQSTCAWWRIDKKRVSNEKIKYAVAVHRGVTRAIFQIDPDSWEETDFYILPDSSQETGEPKKVTRRGFKFETVYRRDPTLPDGRYLDVRLPDGRYLYEEVVGDYGHRIPEKLKTAQYPIQYWPPAS